MRYGKLYEELKSEIQGIKNEISILKGRINVLEDYIARGGQKK